MEDLSERGGFSAAEVGKEKALTMVAAIVKAVPKM